MASVSKIGSKLLFVVSGKMNSFSQYGRSNINLNWDTFNKVNKLKEVEAVVPQVGTSMWVKYKNKNINTYIFGVNSDFLKVREYKVLKGNFFTKYDSESGSNYCVIGYDIYKKLGKQKDIIGNGLYLGKNGIYCRIVGVLSPKGQNFAVNQDERIYVPIKFLQNEIIGNNDISIFYIKVKDEKLIPLVKNKVEKILQKEYKKDAENFTVQSQGEILGTMNFISDTFTIFIFMIAFISLVVGGIGIMNIMLISVNERRKEIGLRKAVGAKSIEIQLQFLIEAVLFTTSGGILGFLFSVLVLFILRLITSWHFYLSPFIVVLSCFISLIIGVVFGFFPAKKASKVTPSETLREL
jgi:putative ABC transport system permease protein